MVLSDLAPSLWINENQPSLLPTSTLTCKRKAPTARTCGCVTSTDRQLNDLVELCEVLSDATKAQEQNSIRRSLTSHRQASTVTSDRHRSGGIDVHGHTALSERTQVMCIHALRFLHSSTTAVKHLTSKRLE